MLKKPIGILGGTFDPIHFGHLRMAVELCQACDLAKVHFIPCYQPVHRELPTATPEQRVAMLRAAIESEPLLCVDECEIERKNPSYMIDTLEILRERFPETPFCLMMGIDAFLGFTAWHRWQAILELSHLVVAHRPQYHLPETGAIADLLKKHLKNSVSDLHQVLSGNIILRPVTSLEISATEIRRQIAEGKNPRYLLPARVYDYICKNKVYTAC